MITIYISSIIRTEETSLVGFKMAWPSGHGRFITVHTSLLRALPLIHLDKMEGAATVNSNSAIAYLTTNNEMVSLALFYLFNNDLDTGALNIVYSINVYIDA